MRLLTRAVGAIRALLHRDETERELDDELRAFVDAAVERRIAAGMTREEAVRAARLDVGNLESAKDAVRDVGLEAWLETFARDARYACRTLRKSPGFAAIAIVTLALGIGANTAIFSVVNTVLLRPVSYDDPASVVRVFVTLPAATSATGTTRRVLAGLTRDELTQLRARTRTLASVGAMTHIIMAVSGREDVPRLTGTRVSGAVFQMLGARPQLGRVLIARDEDPGADEAIVLSDRLWRRHFDGDPGIVGRTLLLESVLGGQGQHRVTVVGVMPREFEFPDSQVDYWLSLPPPPTGVPMAVPIVARLAPNVSLGAASAELNAIMRELRFEAGDSRGRPTFGSADSARPSAGDPTYEVVRHSDELVAAVRPALLVLATAVGFVLLIACTNVANLLLARTAERRREIALRAAIGAGRGRLLRQALTESLVLALIGGALGIALAFTGTRLLRTLATTMSRLDLGLGRSVPRLEEIGIDVRVLMFTLLTAFVTALLFGLAPALRQSRGNLVEGLSDGRNTRAGASGGLRKPALGSVLVVIEISLAMMLLVGGGLLLRSFVKLSNVEPGFEPKQVLTFQVALPASVRGNAQVKAFADQLVERLASMPGIERAAYGRQLPMVQLQDTLRLTQDGARGRMVSGDIRLVSRDYLDILGIRRMAGVELRDSGNPPHAIVINEAMATRDFPGEDPIGRTIHLQRGATGVIVGIVGNVRLLGLDRDPESQMFMDIRDWSDWAFPLFPLGPYYVVRTTSDPLSAVSEVRTAVRALAPQATLFNVAPMEQVVASTIARPRMYAVLLGIFALVGVTLAAIGIYGVLAYAVTQRTREIGIRVALGARHGTVISLVLGQSLVLIAAGLAIGLAGAAAATRYLQGMLFGITPLDRPTFAGVTLLFVLVATAAVCVPARRATRVDPLVALRAE